MTLTLGHQQRTADQEETDFYENKLQHSSNYKMNLFALFSEQTLGMLSINGRFSSHSAKHRARPITIWPLLRRAYSLPIIRLAVVLLDIRFQGL